jgi:hypothetical protein
MTTPANAFEPALGCCWLEASAPLAIGHQGRLQAFLPTLKELFHLMEFNPMYGGVHINFFLGDFEFHFDHGF